ncbi:hypothetical protein B5X24_HaOG211540 [Helicoverpa armigera]|nr:hypothetical protein B5X24_HaOG211540 [Helicoverpa armigera]
MRADGDGGMGALRAGARARAQATPLPDIIFWSTPPHLASRQIFRVLLPPPMNLPSLSHSTRPVQPAASLN